ncbi:hypothetical protein BaRGS_00021317, partial [Batillaria attramentaria]
GCFSNISMDGSFLAYGEKACREFCRGTDNMYAAYYDNTCLCLNQTLSYTGPADWNLCTNPVPNSDNIAKVMLIELSDTVGASCQALMSKGVHISGMYYLNGATSPTMCNFYDGTVCDPDWIGFNGSCYYWDLNHQNYSQAVESCTLRDSVLVAINSQEEANFIQTVNSGIDLFSKEDYWYIGLYDHFGVFARQWSDGSLLTYSGFTASEPNDMEKHDPELMTLTLCFETCRAQGVTYASVSGSTCYCAASLPGSHAKVSWTQCNTPCVGNAYQLCGDPTTGTTLTAFVLEVCGSDFDAYPVVIDNDSEMEAVFNDTWSMQGRTRWIVGLFKYKSKGNFRTSNGRPVGGLRLPESTNQQQCVSYDVTTGQLEESECSTETFICEQGPEYMGCAVRSPNDALVLDDYSEMSVIQCVELCRGQGAKYALLGNTPFRCYCSNTSPNKTTEKCNVFCYAAAGQLCGGADSSTVSAYRVDAFPVFANVCADLFNEGILVPGTYMIQDTPVWCTMKDNTSCVNVDLKEWVSVGESGVCFKLSNEIFAAIHAVSGCKANGSSYLPASIRTQGELDLLDALYWNQFKLGAFTWADGWLLDFVVWDYAASHPFLNYGKADAFFTRLRSDKSLSSRNNGDARRKILCREVTDFLGCYEKPVTLSPAIDNYSSMGITLCKQTCLAQNKDVALLDTGSCFCVDDAELSSQAPVSENDTGCDVACPSNLLQRCADSGRVRGYRVGVHIKLSSQNAPLVPDNYTSCAAGYIGYRGKCYRFFPQTHRTARSAANFCRNVSGYLATPRDEAEVSFLARVIQGIPRLWTFGEWRIGILDLMDGNYQASSDGSMMRSEMWNGTRNLDSTDCSSLNVQNGTWTKSACDQEIPFVCETSSVTATFDLTLTSSSVQQCVTLCYGQNARYALVTPTSCRCVTYDALQGSPYTTVVCPTQCGDHFTQLCGQDDVSTYAVYDIDAYHSDKKSPSSCSEYRQYLVTARGHYPLYVDGVNLMLVECGYLGSKHDDILQLDELAVQYNSSTNSSSASRARLYPEQIWWKSWKPDDTDPTPWLQISLSDYFLVKAISITGREGVGQTGHVTRFDVSLGLDSSELASYAYSLLESQQTATSLEDCKNHCSGQNYPFFGLFAPSAEKDNSKKKEKDRPKKKEEDRSKKKEKDKSKKKDKDKSKKKDKDKSKKKEKDKINRRKRRMTTKKDKGKTKRKDKDKTKKKEKDRSKKN